MKKYAWFSMSVLALMGFLKIFSIIPFNRMSADDFAYGSTVFSQGFWKAQLSWYLSWSGRFTSTFLQTFFGAYSSNSGNSSLFSIITLSLLFFVFLFTLLAVGGNETFGLMVSLILLGSLVYVFIFKKSKKYLLIMFISSITSLLIVYLSPGNSIRAVGGGSDSMNILGSIFYSVQEGPKLLYYLIIKNIIFLSSLTAVLSYVFSQFNKRIYIDKEKIYLNIGSILSLLVIASILYVFPAFKTLGRLPPDRSDITLMFLVLMSVFIVSWHARGIMQNKLLTLLFSFILFISSFSLTSTLGGDVYIARNYSLAFDQMILKIKEASSSGKDELVVINKLPEAGLVANAQTKSDQSDWINKSIADYFKIKGIIAK